VSLSYIRPREKRLLSPEMQLVTIFFTVSIGMLIVTFIFLQLKIYGFHSSMQEMHHTKKTVIQNIKKTMEKIEVVNAQSAQAQYIATHNRVMQESIKNLFDLVPDRIVLSKVHITKSSLILYGSTPNKDIFQFMLQAPLRSIFDRSTTSFYQSPSGVLHFVCKNYLSEDTQ
jgi:hypothetical protein